MSLDRTSLQYIWQKALITAWGSMKTTTISDNKTHTNRIQGKSTLTSLQWYLPPTL